MQKAGYFMEDAEVAYTAEDFRFTVKDDVLYAICLGWPGAQATIKTLKSALYPSEIASVRMLGVDQELSWSMTEDGLTVETPEQRPCEDAYVFKIQRKAPF